MEEMARYFQGLEETITMTTRSPQGGIPAATTNAIAADQVRGLSDTASIRNDDIMDIEEQPPRSSTSLSNDKAQHTLVYSPAKTTLPVRLMALKF